MNSEQRDRAVASFRDDRGPVVLLSSEVGSEGLDFQFCARMFNYDLPWNPMRVEQRIGRLDRYGQASEVIHILNMIVAETIEERIFHRLYERIQIFESSIGDLEAILGEVEVDLASLQRDALSGRLTDAELERRRNLIADVILRRQQDNEVFEQESKQFLSNDDVFLELFNDIERSRALRHARRAAAARRALPRASAGAASARARRAPERRSSGSRGAIAQFRALLARTLARSGGGAQGRARVPRPPARRGHRRHVRPRDRDGAAPARVHLAASPDRARAGAERRGPRRAVVLRRARARPRRWHSSAPHGFFVFELQAHGHEGRARAGRGRRQPRRARSSSGGDRRCWLARGRARRRRSARSLSGADVDRMHRAALDWVTAEVAAREQELQARNDEIVTAQIESLRLSADRRRLWLQEQIQEGRSAPIVRMRRAQLGRLETEHEAKLAQLEAKRGVSVGYRLVAAGLVVPRRRLGLRGSGADARSSSRSTASWSSDAMSPGRSVTNRSASASWYQSRSSGSTSIRVQSRSPTRR